MNPYSSKDHSTFLLCLVSRKYKYKKKTPKFTSKIKPFSDLLNAPFGAILDLPAAHFERRNFSSIAFFVSWGSASPPQHVRNRLRRSASAAPPDDGVLGVIGACPYLKGVLGVT